MNEKWLRQNTVDILRYLPPFLQNDPNFKATNDADSKEHENIRLLIKDLLDNLFVDTGTWGLNLWEQFLNLTPRQKDTYEDRKTRIKLYLNQYLSVTEKYLENLANNYLTDNSADIIPHNEEYYFSLLFNLDGLNNLTGLKEAIELYKPAHLGFKIIFAILIAIKINHKNNIIQYVNAKHNFWNLGTAEPTRWNGVFKWDGSINWSGIKPNSLYKTHQTHKLKYWFNITPWQYVQINFNSEIKQLINSSFKQGKNHKLISTVNIDLKQKTNISNNIDVSSRIKDKQNRSRNRKNLWDGSFTWNGSHKWGGAYTIEKPYEHYCQVITLDKNGNKIQGSVQNI